MLFIPNYLLITTFIFSLIDPDNIILRADSEQILLRVVPDAEILMSRKVEEESFFGDVGELALTLGVLAVGGFALQGGLGRVERFGRLG
jgi:hypothetical protein